MTKTNFFNLGDTQKITGELVLKILAFLAIILCGLGELAYHFGQMFAEALNYISR